MKKDIKYQFQNRQKSKNFKNMGKLKLIILVFLVVLFTIPTELSGQDRPKPTKPKSNSFLPFFKKKNKQPQTRSQRPYSKRKRPVVSRRSQYFAQKGWDFGLITGTSNSLTDIGGAGMDAKPAFIDVQLRTTSLNAGAFARYKFNNNFALNSSFHYGRISGDDKLSPEGSSRYNRGFSFSNQIMEFGVLAEFYIPKYTRSPFDFYAYTGVVMFYHKPNLVVPAGASNTAEAYSNFQPAIPVGLGISYTLPSNIRIGYDISYRKTFFDYLDGFTRPASRGNDAYFFNNIRISYYIKPSRGGYF